MCILYEKLCILYHSTVIAVLSNPFHFYSLVGRARRHIRDGNELSNESCNATTARHSTTAKLARFLLSLLCTEPSPTEYTSCSLAALICYCYLHACSMQSSMVHSYIQCAWGEGLQSPPRHQHVSAFEYYQRKRGLVTRIL